MTSLDERKFFGYKHWTCEVVPRCFYVGKGLRNRPHSYASRNRKWHNVVRRYGLNVEVCVEFLTNDEASSWEIEQIVNEHTFCTKDNLGCNLTKGGEGTSGWKHPDYVRKKLSIAKKLRSAPSQSTRSKLAVAFQQRSKELREKFVYAFRGQHHTAESKSKIAQTKHKRIISTDRNGQERIFESMLEASCVTGIHYSNISGCCLGNRKSAGGFYWRYLEEV